MMLVCGYSSEEWGQKCPFSCINNYNHKQSSMNNFYTYAYLREDGTPYYIGKGKGKRINNRNHGVSLPPEKRRIYLKQNLTEAEAFRHEIYMISVFGRIDMGTGCLRNKTDGGEGAAHNNIWNKGKAGTYEYKSLQKEYVVEKPNGELINIKGLSRFCHENGLNPGHLLETRDGTRRHTKGHKLIPQTKEQIERYNSERQIRENASRKGNLGEKNGMFNRKHMKETKEKMLQRKREIYAKKYDLISPEGNEISVTTTLREFCREYGLDRKSLTMVINGKAKHHKGWTTPQIVV